MRSRQKEGPGHCLISKTASQCLKKLFLDARGKPFRIYVQS